MQNRTFDKIAQKLKKAFDQEFTKNRVVEKITKLAAELGYKLLVHIDVTLAIEEIEPEKQEQERLSENPTPIALSMRDTAFLRQLKIKVPEKYKLP